MSFEQRIPLIRELGFREAGIPQLRDYIQLLWSANEELNLFSRQMTLDELLDNHLIDCLLPLRFFPSGIQSAADFGSGGGLPGVIYAIQFPRMRYQLFEKSPKKREFLTRCKALAPNLEIQGEIPRALKGVEVVTARAFKPLDVILDISREYYQNKGRYFLLKGRMEKIEEELVLARKKFKDLKVQVEPLKSPVLDVERHLVLI
jgi:16S rRNA (guanine527-N7)-methyltransferase